MKHLLNPLTLLAALHSFGCAVVVYDDELPLEDESANVPRNLSTTGGAVSTTGGSPGAVSQTPTYSQPSTGGSPTQQAGSGGAQGSGGAPSDDASAGSGGLDGSGTGGSGGAATPSDCTPIEYNVSSQSFGTTEAVCFVATEGPKTSWQVYSGDGRSVSINGETVSPGHMPWPGSAPYTIEFSAGQVAHTSWSFW